MSLNPFNFPANKRTPRIITKCSNCILLWSFSRQASNQYQIYREEMQEETKVQSLGSRKENDDCGGQKPMLITGRNNILGSGWFNDPNLVLNGSSFNWSVCWRSICVCLLHGTDHKYQIIGLLIHQLIAF